MNQLEIAPLQSLLTHFRYFLTLRSQEGLYHTLILFRLSSGRELTYDASPDGDNAPGSEPLFADIDQERDRQIYIMESTCPHLGADMSHAEIEECEDSVVAVCPWHGYDFDLKTGKSETGLRACTYSVEVKTNPDSGKETVYMESPEGGTHWRLIELRPISEEFADPVPSVAGKDLPKVLSSTESREPEPLVPNSNPPSTLMEWAVLILNTADPILKVERTRLAVQLFRTGKLKSIGHKSRNAPKPPDIPPRDASLRNADPRQARKKKNRAAMLHALANIEQWAIDLAWDIVARFGPRHPNLPPAFFADFTKVALDESKHFSLLTSRLAAISPSTPYGSLPVQAALWESAITTSDSLRARLAIIHLVHEARGLDINPSSTDRFRRTGDMETVGVMETIHADEITHVTAGHRWFTWICAEEGGVDPVVAFREEVKTRWRGDIQGPFNVEDREKAGLTPQFYENLRGEKQSTLEQEQTAMESSMAAVSIGYEQT